MDSGFYAACVGLRAQSQALEVSAHNLANLNTAGFRAQQTTFKSLVALARPNSANVLNYAMNNYGVLEGTRLDLTQGNFDLTGNPLDVAIEGPGFFAVQRGSSIRYTRNGSFRISRAGQLVTAEGDPVLGENGTPLSLPNGAISISPDGTLSVNSAVAGRLRLVEFPFNTKLLSEGKTLIQAPDGAAQAARKSSLRTGMLESSNVDAIGAVVSLIGVQRQAEMMQRALTIFHAEFNRIATTDLPRV